MQIFDIGEQDSLPSFRSNSLREAAWPGSHAGNRSRRIQAVQTVEILARAIAVAHERDIIHRDLKPANDLQ